MLMRPQMLYIVMFTTLSFIANLSLVTAQESTKAERKKKAIRIEDHSFTPKGGGSKVELKKKTVVDGKKRVEVKVIPNPGKPKYVLQLYGFFDEDGFNVEKVIQTSPCRHLHEEQNNGGSEASLEPGDIIVSVGGYLVDNPDSYFAALTEAAKDDAENVLLEVLDSENGMTENWYVKPRKRP